VQISFPEHMIKAGDRHSQRSRQAPDVARKSYAKS
jgi:hypothetical protein